MKDLKYLFAYSGPVLMLLGLLWGGWWSYAFFAEAFLFIPFSKIATKFEVNRLNKNAFS